MSIERIIEEEFQIDESICYLNHAAISPWPVRTSKIVQQFAVENSSLGASNYSSWLKLENTLKIQLKNLINAPSHDDIAILKSTSEALSVVAEGIIWKSGDNIVSTDEEFPSNRIPWLAQKKKGVELRQISLSQNSFSEEALISACDDNTRLLTVSSIQYATGKRLDLMLLGEYCHKKKILFCVDAIQSLGAFPFDCQAIKADFVMADSHKWMLGPEGIALFYCREEIRSSLVLHQYGWHMVEDVGNYDTKNLKYSSTCRRFECGSPNMLGIHALSASLSLIEEIGVNNISSNIIDNVAYMIELLKKVPDLKFISPTNENQYAGIVTFKIEGVDTPQLYSKLTKNMLICANRSGGIRFSPHFYTSRRTIDKSFDILSRSI